MTTHDDIFTRATAPANKRPGCHTAEHLFPQVDEACEITVVCPRADFSASLIARAVEDADAHLINLNVTSENVGPDSVAVDLRINHRNAGSVVRSLARYGYPVVWSSGGFDPEAELMQERIDELFSHLRI